MFSPGKEFWSGVRAELPILLGVIPFGLIYGVLAVGAGLDDFTAQATSAVVFAGSAQFIMTQMFGSGAPGLVIVLTGLVVNLRHALYSLSLAPYLKHLSPAWKWGLAYLLTDEAYAVAIVRFERDVDLQTPSNRHWFFLGAGLTLWSSWQLSTAVGVFLGAQVPASWSLDFSLALTFIALVIPLLRDRPSAASALVAGLTALATYHWPYKLGLIAAALTGILSGLWLESRSVVRAGAREVNS